MTKMTSYQFAKIIKTKHLEGNIFVLKINSVDLYFLKYTGNEDLVPERITHQE